MPLMKGRPGNPAGTPLGLTSECAAAIVEACRRGVSLGVAWRATGMSNTALQRYRHMAEFGAWQPGTGPTEGEHPARPFIRDWLERCAQAYAEWQLLTVQNINGAGHEVNTKTGIHEWRAHAWLLEHGDSREDFYLHKEPAVKVNVGIITPERERVATLDQQQLVELVGNEWLAVEGG